MNFLNFPIFANVLNFPIFINVLNFPIFVSILNFPVFPYFPVFIDKFILPKYSFMFNLLFISISFFPSFLK